MWGSVETAKRLLEQGNCVGVNCIKDCCPLYDEDDPCCDCSSGLSNAGVRKLQEFIKENEKMTKEDQIIEVVTAFKAGKEIQARGIGTDRWFRHDKDLQPRWNFEVNEYRVAPEPQYRPLNTEELSELVGTVLVTKDRGFHILATAFNPISEEVFLGNEWCDANRLYDLYLHLNGSPVGVLIK